MPKPSTNPPTEKQLIQRAKFGMVMHFLSPVSVLLNESYRKINRKKAGMQVAAKQIFAEAITGEYPQLKIDFSRVRLIRGNLASPHFTLMKATGTAQLNFNWRADMQFNGSSADELLVLIYCSSVSDFWYTPDLRIRRSEEACSIQIPPAFVGHELQVWLAFRSENHRSYSGSLYMGKCFNADDHENKT